MNITIPHPFNPSFIKIDNPTRHLIGSTLQKTVDGPNLEGNGKEMPKSSEQRGVYETGGVSI